MLLLLLLLLADIFSRSMDQRTRDVLSSAKQAVAPNADRNDNRFVSRNSDFTAGVDNNNFYSQCDGSEIMARRKIT